MEMEQIFSQRLKNARVMNGYSYKDFAEALDNRVSAQTLRNYENGVSFPKSDVMNAMLRVLHIKIDTLFAHSLSIGRWSNLIFVRRTE